MGVSWYALCLQCRKLAHGPLLAYRFHHCNRPLLSLPSTWHHRSHSSRPRAVLCHHSLTYSSFLRFSFLLLDKTLSLLLLFFPAVISLSHFSAFLPTSSLWALPKVYSPIHCSCLLMMCFLETSSRIPVSIDYLCVENTQESQPLRLHFWPLFRSPSS